MGALLQEVRQETFGIEFTVHEPSRQLLQKIHATYYLSYAKGITKRQFELRISLPPWPIAFPSKPQAYRSTYLIVLFETMYPLLIPLLGAAFSAPGTWPRVGLFSAQYQALWTNCIRQCFCWQLRPTLSRLESL